VTEQTDVAIVGVGAAGLMATIWAGRTQRDRRIVVLDSAKKLGAKILVAGGGRCNVTHHQVDESAFAGSSRNAIKKVLRRFDVDETVQFFAELGVELKREETGKLFPVTDDAQTVLDALLHAAAAAGAELLHPHRVESIRRQDGRFVITGPWGALHAEQVVLATGGKSLPKTGSDGHGYAIARSLGHSISPRLLPGLVPLTLPRDHFICQLSGITAPAMIELRSSTGKRLISFTNSTLCTHFGLSGPSVLDISRYYLEARLDDANTSLMINWLPDQTGESFDQRLRELGRTTILAHLRGLIPERLARALCEYAGIDAAATGASLTRAQRQALVQVVTQLPLPITGDRGYNYAEVTAGGAPLSELHLDTMESRICPGLHLCGEICDVDGRIGGFNFQWAWSSGYTAGVSVGRRPARAT
jgi:hypothetical protein